MCDSFSYATQYLIPWARVGSPRADTQDREVGGKLWGWLEEQVRGL